MKADPPESERKARSLFETICRHLGYKISLSDYYFKHHQIRITPPDGNSFIFYVHGVVDWPFENLLYRLDHTDRLINVAGKTYPWVFYDGQSLDEIDINLALQGVH